jgi:hypothetical protein
MKNVFIFLSLSLLLMSCEGACNKMDRNGSIVGKTAGNWVVIRYNGGVITDVWKLKNVLVQSEENSDGWLFRDQNDNMINVSGDIKAIRIRQNDKESFYNQYTEYHLEFDSMSYHQRRALALKEK